MTNFDPVGFLMLLTVIPAVVAGAISVGVSQLTSRHGYGDYETTVAAVVGVLIIGWIGVSLLVTTSMMQILAVMLSMIGAFAATRSITASSTAGCLASC